MKTVIFGIAHYAGLLLLWALAYGVGRRVLRRIEFASMAEAIVYSTAAGLGFTATAVFILGLLSFLNVSALVALTVGVAFAAAGPLDDLRRTYLTRWRAMPTRRPAPQTIFVVAVCAAPILLLIPQSLYPPHLWDAMAYHLPFAKWFANSGEIRPVLHLRFPIFPQLQEMLFASMLTLADDVMANLTQFLALALIVVAVFDFSARRYGVPAALLACGLVLGIPSVVLYATTSYVDVGLSLYCVLCVLAFERWRESGATGFIALSGLMGGFAASTKYTGLAIVGITGIATVIVAVSRRRPAAVLAFSIACAAVAAPWYIRNVMYTGNPVFPVMSEVFGDDPYWRPEDYKALAEHWGEYGDRSLKGFLRLPYDLTFKQEDFERSAPWTWMFLLLPLILTGVRRREDRFLVIVIVLYLGYWFTQAQIYRFLLPIIPLYAIALASTVVFLAARIKIRISVPAAAIIFTSLLVPTMHFAWGMRKGAGPIPANQVERDAFYNRFGAYRCYQWLNEKYGRDYVLYSFTGEEATYFADGVRAGDIFGTYAYDKLRTETPEKLFDSLRGFGANFLMGSKVEHFWHLRRTQPTFMEHFQVVCGSGATRVWKLSEETLHPILGPELLRNAGDPGPDLMQPGQTITSTAAVHPETIYEIEYDVAAGAGVRTLRSSVVWLDAKGKTITTDGQAVRLPLQGGTIDIPLLTPRRSRKAIVTLVAVTEPVRVTRVSMRELAYDERALKSIAPVDGAPLAVPAEQPKRGLRLTQRSGDEVTYAITERISIVEFPVPPGVARGRRWRFDFDVNTDLVGPFAVRFIGSDGSVSQPAWIAPLQAPDQGGGWTRFRVIGPDRPMPALATIRLDPPAAASAGEFRLRKMRIAETR